MGKQKLTNLLKWLIHPIKFYKQAKILWKVIKTNENNATQMHLLYKARSEYVKEVLTPTE